ncbi:hypothetical protein LUZ63_012952 [Rhynchospora breviuscula]|uniref:F-box domain-containing protein n=1 Tax=Rhynchospora breviuscula TaxID=2022672 RepID=A0A9Q0HJR3_9POAL|nr:hypothetical protein LUZ63_012952 [Rhynchospora breviuscula]
MERFGLPFGCAPGRTPGRMTCFQHYFHKKEKAAKGMDHLSNLQDELIITILSFLPLDIAARTSVLCRRIRHLWEASPSLQFICP